MDVQEDDLLNRLIAQHGTTNWSLIAKFVPGRSGKSCKCRFPQTFLFLLSAAIG